MSFSYLSSKYKGETLDNEDLEISYDDIKYLHEENGKDKQECDIVTDGKLTPHDFDDFLQYVMLDFKITGYLLGYPYGMVIRQGERNHYYRGENELFPSSTSTLQRCFNPLEDFEFKKFISYMRIREFEKFIRKFRHVEYWQENYSDVYGEAIAQHYGIKTNLLDITNDFDTALFFATCRFEDSKWRPLTKRDIEKNENSRYGRIFHAPSWQVMLKNMVSGSNNDCVGGIWPIGFQPFMRCHMQYGYAMDCDEGYCMQKDVAFEKLIFKHSEKLSEKVFEFMDEGRKIYPQEGLNKFQNIIDKIGETKIFSEDSFDYACEKLKYSKEEIEEIKNKLNEQKYVIDEFKLNIDINRIKEIDNEYKDFSIEKEYGIKISSRLMFL